MKKLSTLFFTLLLLVSYNAMNAQTPTGSDYLKAYKKAGCTIPFDVNAEGQSFHIKWGMDVAWDWTWNITRGVNYYEKGKFETGRISFQPNDLVTDNGDGTYTLSSRQQSKLKTRINHIKATGVTEVNINCDHEALFKNGSNDDFTGRNNYQGKPEEWYKLIKASVQYAQKQGMKVVSISPFNEPDYGWQQFTNGSEGCSESVQKNYGMKEFLEICKLIKADSFFDGIRICGGNTLNNDRAKPWYDYLKDYLDEGNTHQLAGSFDNYAKFFTQVKADGKVASADELHNVGEAIVGVNYGMEIGIWWGFDSRARGQFMHDSNEGVRLGYGENRSAWTDGAVYRNNETGEVHGYLGSSERQANTSSFQFVSTTRDVYFNGEGPTRNIVYDIPGGTGYQKGQINAERVFDITWGEDVAPGVIDGTYQIMNLSQKKMLTWKGTDNVQTASRLTSGTTQQWKVYPSYTDGDISFWFIDNVATSSTKINLNVRDNNLEANAGVICWDANHGAVEQWYLKYAKDGYYYIISRLSNKYLYAGSSVSLQNPPTENTTNIEHNKYLWRFQPIDARADVNPPVAPSALTAKQRAGSIELSWNASEATTTQDGATNYIILRAEAAAEGETPEWNTIGRIGAETSFLDNTAIAGKNYIYKVRGVDYAGNRSAACEPIEASVISEQRLLCQLQMDDSLADNTANRFDLKFYGTEKYSNTAAMKKSGDASLSFDGSSYGMLPYAVADQDEMTISAWVRWTTSGGSWSRVFDFGNDETHYMFFTPSNGSEMRFVMKDGGEEQILTNGKKLSTITSWKHVAITLKPIEGEKVRATLYVDGDVMAQSDDFTIKPSDIKPSLCYIGGSMFSDDPMFKGYIDDFRIYNYALNAEEVAAVINDTEAISKDVNDDYTEVNPTSISTIKNASSKKGIYDLSGRKISKPNKGMYIEDGVIKR